MNWEMTTDIYTLFCVKQIASGKLLHGSGSLARCLMTTRGIGWGLGGKEAQREGMFGHLMPKN